MATYVVCVPCETTERYELKAESFVDALSRWHEGMFLDRTEVEADDARPPYVQSVDDEEV